MNAMEDGCSAATFSPWILKKHSTVWITTVASRYALGDLGAELVTLDWVECFLYGRTMSVKINNTMSPTEHPGDFSFFVHLQESSPPSSSSSEIE